MNNFALFANKGTGYAFLNELIVNNLNPSLVITQTPSDVYLKKNGIKKLIRYVKLLLSILSKRRYYNETFDVYYLCKRNKIPVLSSLFSNTDKLIRKCEKYNIDNGIVFTFSVLLKKNVIDSFKKGIINFHPSLLPKHRGQDPVFRTIYNGDKISGITIHLIDEKMDNGKILLRKKSEIKEEDNVNTLSNMLLQSGIKELLFYIKNGRFNYDNPIDEDESIFSSYEPPISDNLFLIDDKTDSNVLKRLFRSSFSNFRPYIIENDEKIIFQKYEEVSSTEYKILSENFLLEKNNDFYIIKTNDGKIIELFK